MLFWFSMPWEITFLSEKHRNTWFVSYKKRNVPSCERKLIRVLVTPVAVGKYVRVMPLNIYLSERKGQMIFYKFPLKIMEFLWSFNGVNISWFLRACYDSLGLLRIS